MQTKRGHPHYLHGNKGCMFAIVGGEEGEVEKDRGEQEKEELVASVKAKKREGLERIFEVFPFEYKVPCVFWVIDLEVMNSNRESSLLRFKIKLRTINPTWSNSFPCTHGSFMQRATPLKYKEYPRNKNSKEPLKNVVKD